MRDRKKIHFKKKNSQVLGAVGGGPMKKRTISYEMKIDGPRGPHKSCRNHQKKSCPQEEWELFLQEKNTCAVGRWPWIRHIGLYRHIKSCKSCIY